MEDVISTETSTSRVVTSIDEERWLDVSHREDQIRRKRLVPSAGPRRNSVVEVHIVHNALDYCVLATVETQVGVRHQYGSNTQRCSTAEYRGERQQLRLGCTRKPSIAWNPGHSSSNTTTMKGAASHVPPRRVREKGD